MHDFLRRDSKLIRPSLIKDQEVERHLDINAFAELLCVARVLLLRIHRGTPRQHRKNSKGSRQNSYCNTIPSLHLSPNRSSAHASAEQNHARLQSVRRIQPRHFPSRYLLTRSFRRFWSGRHTGSLWHPWSTWHSRSRRHPWRAHFFRQLRTTCSAYGCRKIVFHPALRARFRYLRIWRSKTHLLCPFSTLPYMNSAAASLSSANMHLDGF